MLYNGKVWELIPVFSLHTVDSPSKFSQAELKTWKRGKYEFGQNFDLAQIIEVFLFYFRSFRIFKYLKFIKLSL